MVSGVALEAFGELSTTKETIMSGKRTRALRADLRENLPDADQSDHRAYRKSVRDQRRMKAGTPRSRRTKGLLRHRTWRILGRRADGATRVYKPGEDLTHAFALEHAARLNSISHDFWWAMHSLSYEPQVRSRRPIYDVKLAKPSRRRFWG